MNNTIDKIIKKAKQQLPPKQADLAAVFIREFYSDSIWSDFAKRDLADLCGVVLAHWAMFWQRKPEQYKIRVFNPDKKQNGWACDNTVIAIVHPDMPFLVDSLQMALNKLDARIYTLVHLGGIKVNRDAKGNINKIVPIKDSQNQTQTAAAAMPSEAPIYIEIERQNDAEALSKISAALESVLADVRAAVGDWEAVKQKLKQVAGELKQTDHTEEQAFLHWLADNNFVLLGYRYYKLTEVDGEPAFTCVENSGLGVLRNKSAHKIYRYHKDLSPQAIEVISSAAPLILSKTNTVSTVHKACYTDSVAIKSYDKKTGKIVAIHRFIGLYTSTAYYSSVRSIPFLRRKADAILDKFGFPRNGYSAKALLQILETLPRDEFIQAEVDELYEIAVGVFQLYERRLTKLFVRKDLYGRYVSCLVYLPRDNFNTEVRLRIQKILLKSFHGLESSFDIFFSESILVRLYFVIRVDAVAAAAEQVTFQCGGDLIKKSRVSCGTNSSEGAKCLTSPALACVDFTHTRGWVKGVERTKALKERNMVAGEFPQQLPSYDLAAIEQEIIEASSSWYDMLHEVLLVHYAAIESEVLFAKYRAAFPAGYRETFAGDLVLRDIQKIEQLNSQHRLEMLFYTSSDILFRSFRASMSSTILTQPRACVKSTHAKAGLVRHLAPSELVVSQKARSFLTESATSSAITDDADRDTSAIIHFKLFYLNQEIPLSDALPILENMGLRIISEQSYQIKLPNQQATSSGDEVTVSGVNSSDPSEYVDYVSISDFKMLSLRKNALVKIADVYAEFQEVFAKVWHGEVENDSFNQLVLAAGMNWREITIFRAYAKYLHQIRFPFTQQFLATVLVAHPSITKLLLEVFKLRFTPLPSSKRQSQQQKENSEKLAQIKNEIQAKLETITSLDEDRVLTRFLSLIETTVRTNYYQNQHNSKNQQNQQNSPYFAYKFSCRDIQDLPLPKPLFEIFVYSPRFEGTHLRMAKVARGGLRWSDRREDFRTEILGLMKAQQVKNVVIVPYGAKGGFVLKKISASMSRDEAQQEGVACYKNFISALLDITDNIKDDEIVRPAQVVCHDEPDPYLVVAADKGTATFSNIANGIAKSYGFWLGDAFASGGATGYDHKQIGITARGAWESVKHHFHELGIDVQNNDFTVVGIGDMAGDVFGNGMLLSKHIKLVGAFNHLHIFLDPNPDVARSFAERERLFKLPQSSWDDYRRELISSGGGVYLRSAKSIALSSEAQALLGINKERATPNEVVRGLLLAKVDLLWNGGIGTYVKASSESHESVGDRSNDGLRVNGNELCCKVVAEGGNLGFTQLGRIEFAEQGGIINTDFIDNSGGVDCSDHEVNLKILLNELVKKKIISEQERNELLASMTEEVSELVLRNNYRQTRVIGLITAQSAAKLDELAKYIDTQEQCGKLNRTLECLPSNKTIAERKSAGRGLTRPEVAILLAYSKLILKEEILNSKLMEIAELDSYLAKEFPATLLKKFGKYLAKHRLRREIISTQLSNDFITNKGITFIQEQQTATGAKLEDIIRAYLDVKEVQGG